MEGALQTTLIIADAGHMAILSFIHAVIFPPVGLKLKSDFSMDHNQLALLNFVKKKKKAIELWTSS